MITPFFSSFVEMSDDWDTFTVKDGDETFTVNADDWSCSCKIPTSICLVNAWSSYKESSDCVHIRMAQEYLQSWWRRYEHYSERAAMLYNMGE